MKLLLLIVSVAAALLASSCRKDLEYGHCSTLQNGIAKDKKDKVESALTDIILELGDKQYNEKNLRTLCERISSDCNIDAELQCYDCIETNPAQSEVKITVGFLGITKTKVIDLTQTKESKIVFSGMHE